MCYLVQNDTLKGKRKKKANTKPQKENTTTLKKTHETALHKYNPQITCKEKEQHKALSLAFSDTSPWGQDFRGVTKLVAA